MRNIHIVAYIYVCCCVASFIVDVTFGIHFGMDFGTFNNMLVSELDVLLNFIKMYNSPSKYTYL